MNFKYYNSKNLILLILALTFFITPISKFIEEKIFESGNFNILYGYFGIFSTISLLTIVLILIDNYLWKYNFFSFLVDLPDLNGRYEGELISTFIDPSTNQKIKKKCVLEINQNASKIKINSFYGDIFSLQETSNSVSVSEEIIKLENNFFEIFYIFTNNAASLQEELNNHIGTCKLKYFKDKKSLEGEYYNDRGYKGTIHVSFIQTQKLGRLNS